MNVKTIFLDRNLDEEVFMDQLESFMVEGKKHMVCKLKRSIYGLNKLPDNSILSAMMPSDLLVLKKTSLIDVYT